MTVGVGLGDIGSPYGLAGAGAVFGHHGLAQALLQVLGDQPADDVGRSAGRRGHDHAHRLRGELLRAHGRQHTRGQERGGPDRYNTHGFSSLL